MSIDQHDGDDDAAPSGSEVVRLDESRPPAEEVIALRQGEVLIKQTLLKADHFPGECAGGGGRVGLCV